MGIAAARGVCSCWQYPGLDGPNCYSVWLFCGSTVHFWGWALLRGCVIALLVARPWFVYWWEWVMCQSPFVLPPSPSVPTAVLQLIQGGWGLPCFFYWSSLISHLPLVVIPATAMASANSSVSARKCWWWVKFALDSAMGKVLLIPRFDMPLFQVYNTGHINNGLGMAQSTIRLRLVMPMILVCLHPHIQLPCIPMVQGEICSSHMGCSMPCTWWLGWFARHKVNWDCALPGMQVCSTIE